MEFGFNWMTFSTFDSDSRPMWHGICNCAADHGGGWWFDWCTAAGLNYDSDSIWAVSNVDYDWDVQACTHVPVRAE